MKAETSSKKVTLKLNGKATVFVDWANVYGWKKSLKKEPNPKAIFRTLKKYENIFETNFYFGTDNNPQSKNFLRTIKNIGYKLITKPVKHIFVAEVNGQKIYRRKCDFDMEICMDVYKALENKFDSYIFFSGDGDFEPLYKMLVKLRKQVIVIYAKGHLGKEIWELDTGVFKTEFERVV